MGDRSQQVRRLIIGSLRGMVQRMDNGGLSPDEARRQLAWFALVERLAAAGKTLAAGIAIADEPWVRSGDRSAASWLAKQIDATVGDAKSVLTTAEHLPDAPTTAEHFRSGELTVEKAEAVVLAAAVAPAAEPRLLDAAQHGSVKRVRDESARVRAAADPDPESRHDRIRRGRCWRRWTDADGSRCGMYRLTPESGALLEAAAQPFVDAAIDDARRSGSDDSFDALAADGLVAMAHQRLDRDTELPRARGGRGRKRLQARRELIALVDVASLKRGRADLGETCEIAGVGPVPVAVVRDLFGDALLRIVIRDGVDVKTVVHTGRTASAVQETAVIVQQGGRCGRPHCDLPPAEIDHDDGYPLTGPVSVEKLLGLCGHDHDLKTNHGHTWRRAEDGSVVWIRPDRTEERERPPP